MFKKIFIILGSLAALTLMALIWKNTEAIEKENERKARLEATNRIENGLKKSDYEWCLRSRQAQYDVLTSYGTNDPGNSKLQQMEAKKRDCDRLYRE